MQIVYMFSSETYTTSTAPEKYQNYFKEFKQDALLFNKDISKLDSMKVVIIKNKKWVFGGYCNELTNTIYINDYYPFMKVTVFHELGHCLFNYRHKKDDMIMNNSVNVAYDPAGLAWEDQKKHFFTSDYSRSFKELKDESFNTLINNPIVFSIKNYFRSI